MGLNRGWADSEAGQSPIKAPPADAVMLSDWALGEHLAGSGQRPRFTEYGRGGPTASSALVVSKAFGRVLFSTQLVGINSNYLVILV